MDFLRKLLCSTSAGFGLASASAAVVLVSRTGVSGDTETALLAHEVQSCKVEVGGVKKIETKIVQFTMASCES